jgi:hypothetical protein
LLELVVVVAILAVLAALAVPNYNLFKSNANNATAASDARGLAPAAELVAATGGLSSDVILDGSGGPIPELPGAVASPGVVGVITVGPNSYEIEVEHLSGNVRYRIDSDAGLTSSPLP